ncbi:MAG: M67 family peptidase [Chloroflexi bacterium]|nr:MAG: M67 family peptidase [Chloroflexota bacterium]
MNLKLEAALYRQITAHLCAAYPKEAAGLLLGTAAGASWDASRMLPLTNKFAHAEQYHRYLITAEDMLEGEDHAATFGLDVVGVFHSHPDSAPQPSDYDCQHALPWYLYLIVSITAGEPASARAWQLREDRSDFNEAVLEIGPAAPARPNSSTFE